MCIRDRSQVQQAVEKKPKVSGGQTYISKSLNQVLVSAEDEAKAMGDEYVSVEHLFLSLMKYPNTEIKKLFQAYGITRERFLQALSTVKMCIRDRKNVMIKRLRIAVFIAVSLGIVLIVFRYFGFVSKTIYEESVSHLTEVFHQSDNMLRELTDKNLNYLHMWGENLQDISSEGEIRDYIKKAQEDAGFLDFFFLSADGNLSLIHI